MANPLETFAVPVGEQTGDEGHNGGEFGRPADNRGAFMGVFMDRMRQNADERRENQQWRGRERQNPTPPGQGGDAGSLAHHGSIGSLRMPRGFARSEEKDPRHPINTSVHSPDSYRVFRLNGHPDTKICYWKLDAHAPGEESHAALQRLLTPGRNNPPHKLSQEEIDAISEAIPSALYGYNGNFQVLQISTADVNGKRVLMMETDYRDTDRRTIGIFANPDLKTSSVEMVWFEAPKAQYRAHAKDAWHAISNINWEGQQPQQPQQQQQPRLFRRIGR